MSYSHHRLRLILVIIALLLLTSVGLQPRASAQDSNMTTTIERFSLVLYDFDSPIPGPLNDRILESLVFPEITPDTDIEIIGYSDVVGIEARNRILAQQRADTIAARIRMRLGPDGFRSMQTAAVIEENALFRNDIPEGRFLSRTVVITFRNQPEEVWWER